MTDAPTPQRFRTLVLLYPVIDARWGSGLLRKRARRVMTREERARHRRRRRAAPRDRPALERRAGRARPARRHRGPPADPDPVIERWRALVGRAARGPSGARGARRARPLRLGLRALAVRSRGAPVRLGLHDRTVRRDVRRRVQLDLDRPLADARHRPGPGAGLRPRVAPPGRVGLPGAGDRTGPPARSPRRGRLHVGARPAGAAVRPLLRRVPRRERRAGRGPDVVAVVPRLDDRPAASTRRGGPTAGPCRSG